MNRGPPEFLTFYPRSPRTRARQITTPQPPKTNWPLGCRKQGIGVDGSKPALDAVAAGTLTATVFQDAVGQGTQAMDAASKILAGETVDPQIVIPFKLVTKENVSSFK